MIGALASNMAPRLFYKMVMIAASPHYIDEPDYPGGTPRTAVDSLIAALTKDYLAWCEQVVPLALGEPRGSVLSGELMRSFSALDPLIARHLATVIYYSDHRRELSEVNVETLVIQPATDPFVPVAVGKFIAERIKRGHLLVVKAPGGHFPHLGAPAEIHRAIASFFEGSVPVARSG
jgi:sigma-B regulation protein RsbQ